MENPKKKKTNRIEPTNTALEPESESDPATNIWSFITARSRVSWFLCVSLFAVLIRLAVALLPYSGAHTPPMFGDYEAQRHWMEITVSLPFKEWYRNSTANDIQYWGLDYPPLTAYPSYFHGVLLKFFDPASVALFSSRGYESYLGKLLMRWMVLMYDLMIFFPAVLYFVNVYNSGKPNGDRSSMAWHAVMILLNPCLILIDHGHFQKLVITTRSVEYMPFYLSLFSFLNAICWTSYALVSLDLFHLAPNAVGALLGLAQLILYATYKSTNKIIAAKKAQKQVSLTETNHHNSHSQIRV